jgi:hypothetical protein
MARYHGKQGAVYIGTTSAAVPTVITMATWSLSMTRDRVDVTSFHDANKQYVQGLSDISGSISGFFDDTSDVLYDAAASAGAVKMYLYPSTTVATKYWYGTAFLDFTINAAVNGAVEISGTFAGASDWGQY